MGRTVMRGAGTGRDGTRRRGLVGAVVLGALLVGGPGLLAQEEGPAAEEPKPYEPPLEVRIDDVNMPVLVPRGERLEFRARVRLVGIEADAGRVTLQAEVRPYRAGLLARAGDAERETGRIEARAVGEYGVYSMDSRIETLLQPQEWPGVVHRFTQTGTENRRREILLGRKDGSPRISYRSDTKNGAPPGTRIWRDPHVYEVPSGTLDHMSAVYLVRSMVRDGRRLATLHTLDKDRVWQTALTLGEECEVETPVGRFRARQVHLATRLVTDRGEAVDDEEADERDEGFSGPFGIRGHIQMFVEAATGVPIAVSGRIPAGPIDIDLDVSLVRYEGTPPEFRPIGAPAEGDGGAAPQDGAEDGAEGDDGAGDGGEGPAPQPAGGRG